MRSKSKAVFLDRDGTLIEDRGFIKDKSHVVFLPGVFDALRKLQKYFLLCIVTNQNSEQLTDFQIAGVNQYVCERLAKEGIKIQEIYSCNHSKVSQCQCRKPSPFFLEKAAKDYRIDLHRSFVIGDHPCDVLLAKNTGACGIYVLTGHGAKHRDEVPADTRIASGIVEAAEKIISCHRKVQLAGRNV